MNNPETNQPKQINKRTDSEPTNYGLYSHVAIQISAMLSKLRYANEFGLQGSLEEKFRRMETGVEYDQYAEEFASKYWLRNYWKAVYACVNVLEFENISEICSLGAGSGADAVAVATALSLTGSSSSIDITLVDKSSRQLELANQIISGIKPVLYDNNLVIESVHDEIQFYHSVRTFDLVVISHVLTENPNSLSSLLTNAIDLLSDKGVICIVERERDPVWNNAFNYLSEQSGLVVFSTAVSRSKLNDLLIPLGDLKETLIDMTPHYVVATRRA